MKKLLPLLLLFACVHARAQTPPTCLAAIPDPVPRNAVRWSWTAPTTNTDGTVIKQPIVYTIYEGTTKICQLSLLNKPTGAASWTNLPVGAHSWTFTATTTDGESVPSAVVSKTIAPAPPNPPTNIQVDPNSLTAYSPFKSGGKNLVSAIGSVPPGTMCDVSNGVLVDGVTYYAVPIASVSFTNPFAKPFATAIVAQCG